MLKRIFLIISIVLFFLSPAYPFDKSPGKFKEFEGWKPKGDKYVIVDQYWVEITTFGYAEGLYPDVVDGKLIYRRIAGFFALHGSGYHLGNGWLVTASHVVDPKIMVARISSSASWIIPIDRVVSINYSIGNNPSDVQTVKAELMWIDYERDLALLWVDLRLVPFLKNNTYSTVRTFEEDVDYLEKGDSIAVIAKVRDEEGGKGWYYEVRYGKVISPKVVLPGNLSPDILPWFNMNDFTLDVEIYPGDSGSPVFAFRNGTPVIIGIVRARAWYTMPNGKVIAYGYATRIDLVHRKMLEVTK